MKVEALDDSVWESLVKKIGDDRLKEQESLLEDKFKLQEDAKKKTTKDEQQLLDKIESWLALKQHPTNPKHFNEILYGNRSFRNPFLLKSLVKMYNIDEKEALKGTLLLDHPLGYFDDEKRIVSDAVALLNPPASAPTATTK